LIALTAVVLAGAAVLAVLPRRESAPPPAPLTAAEMVANAAESIAVLGDGFGHGTGFLIADGILATNAHVTESMFLEDIEVYFGDAQDDDHVLQLLYEDPERDLCLLSIQTSRTPLSLAPGDAVPRGTELLIIGNPGLGTAVVEKAVARGLAGSIVDLDGVEFLQISASVNPGNSGGPVLDPEGRVVSVVTMKATRLEGIAFGVPPGALRLALAGMDRADDDALASLALRHDVGAAHNRLSSLGGLHLEVAQAGIAAGAIAKSAGQEPLQVLLEVQREAAGQLIEGRLHLRALQPRIVRLGQDKRLTPAHRRRLGQAWAMVAAMDRRNRVPPTDLDEFLGDTNNAAIGFGGLCEELERDLVALAGR